MYTALSEGFQEPESVILERTWEDTSLPKEIPSLLQTGVYTGRSVEGSPIFEGISFTLNPDRFIGLDMQIGDEIHFVMSESAINTSYLGDNILRIVNKRTGSFVDVGNWMKAKKHRAEKIRKGIKVI